MIVWILVICIVIALAAAAYFRVRYELKTLQTVHYTLESEKIASDDQLRAVFLTDLHNRSYGVENEELTAAISREHPDVILCAGDMLTASVTESYEKSRDLFQRLSEIAPVYAAPGNHEKRISLKADRRYPAFLKYKEGLCSAGVTYLENSSAELNQSIYLSGLDIDFRYYNKLKRQKYSLAQMKKDLAEPDRTRFNIVLAHNPRFFKTYADFGADLFLAGHYHGGAVRIARRIGVISPQFRPFPRYSRGLYRRKDAAMIVSAGCGSHKVNLRLFNKPEIVVIDIHGHII